MRPARVCLIMLSLFNLVTGPLIFRAFILFVAPEWMFHNGQHPAFSTCLSAMFLWAVTVIGPLVWQEHLIADIRG